jgi:hypothetical protein
MAGSDAVNVARGEPESLIKPGTPLRRRAYLTPHTPSYIVAQPRQKSRRGANTMRLSTATERFLIPFGLADSRARPTSLCV